MNYQSAHWKNPKKATGAAVKRETSDIVHFFLSELGFYITKIVCVVCGLLRIKLNFITLICENNDVALTLYSIIALLTPSKYHVFENVMENGAFALSEQMLHFP